MAMTDDELAVIEQRWAKVTPGPWRWSANTSGNEASLAGKGGLFVMTFDRWGMRGALPNFPGEHAMERADKWFVRPAPHNPWDVRGIDHPNAIAIAAAPADVDALLAELRRLRAAAEQPK